MTGLILFFLSIFCLPQGIYYHQDSKLIINNKVFEITIDSKTYNIKNGYVTQDGKYICGELINIAGEEKISNLDDVYIPPSHPSRTKKFISYNTNTKKVLVQNVQLLAMANYFGEFIYFRENLDQQVFSLADYSQVYSSKNTKIKYYVRGDNLFSLTNKRDIKIFNKETCSFEFVRNVEFKFENILFFYNSKILASFDKEVKILHGNDVIDVEKFLSISDFISNDELFVWGCIKDDCRDLGMYHFNKKTESFDYIFSLTQFLDPFNFFENSFLKVIYTNDKLYCLTPPTFPDNLMDIFSYDLKTKKFTKETNSGNIEWPIGSFNKSN